MSPLDKVFRQSLGGVGQQDLQVAARAYSPFKSPNKEGGSGLFRDQSPNEETGRVPSPYINRG
jgi:hypothetical protein